MSDPNLNDPSLLRSALQPAGDCPELAALSAAEPNPDVLRHLAGCSRCRTELAMLREFEGGEPEAAEAASVQWIQSELLRRAPQFTNVAPGPAPLAERLHNWIAEAFAPRRRFVLAMAGMAAVLIVGAGVYSRRGGESSLAGPSQPVVWRSGQFSAVSPIGDIALPPSAFQWESVPGAVKYGIKMTGVDGVEVWSAESGQTSIEPPPQVRALLTPGRAFHWRVEAQNAASEKIASTDSQTFHILATSR